MHSLNRSEKYDPVGALGLKLMAQRLKDLAQQLERSVAQLMGHATYPAALHTVQLKQLDHHFGL